MFSDDVWKFQVNKYPSCIEFCQQTVPRCGGSDWERPVAYVTVGAWNSSVDNGETSAAGVSMLVMYAGARPSDDL